MPPSIQHPHENVITGEHKGARVPRDRKRFTIQPKYKITINKDFFCASIFLKRQKRCFLEAISETPDQPLPATVCPDWFARNGSSGVQGANLSDFLSVGQLYIVYCVSSKLWRVAIKLLPSSNTTETGALEPKPNQVLLH